MSTNAKSAVEIGLVVAEILVGYANSCRLIQTGADYTLITSWITELIFIKFTQDIATIPTLNILELELPYFPERQPAECRSFCQFNPKMVAMATFIEESEKRSDR